jgi:UDP-N-acetylmuramoylalanine--D-glutamate ligase
MKELLEKYVSGKKVLILGFGLEGRSTLKLLRRYFPDLNLAVADKNTNLDISGLEKDPHLNFILGENYLEQIPLFDMVFKTPGISLNGSTINFGNTILLSQSSVFIENYKQQIIGITGTKGKSTTSSLIYHLLQTAGKDSVFVGNIGQPPFEAISKINSQTIIVFEMSSHQLEHTFFSPHTGILLNVFEEHLDHYHSFEKYSLAKLNIAKYQTGADYFIFNGKDAWLNNFITEGETKGIKIGFASFSSPEADIYIENETIKCSFLDRKPISISERTLRGNHNLNNILAATATCLLQNVAEKDIETGIRTFKPLEHRLEYVGTFCGIEFINDSISTIPESTMEAVNTIENTDTIILGGFDRGIDYRQLIEFLADSSIHNFIFTGPAGKHMLDEFLIVKKRFQQTFFIQSFNELPAIISGNTKPGKACLLSPAASSYDQFKNFEERGRLFKKIAGLIGESCH